MDDEDCKQLPYEPSMDNIDESIISQEITEESSFENIPHHLQQNINNINQIKSDPKQKLVNNNNNINNNFGRNESRIFENRQVFILYLFCILFMHVFPYIYMYQYIYIYRKNLKEIHLNQV